MPWNKCKCVINCRFTILSSEWRYENKSGVFFVFIFVTWLSIDDFPIDNRKEPAMDSWHFQLKFKTLSHNKVNYANYTNILYEIYARNHRSIDFSNESQFERLFCVFASSQKQTVKLMTWRMKMTSHSIALAFVALPLLSFFPAFFIVQCMSVICLMVTWLLSSPTRD